jgi:hypothetical protein
MRTFPWGRSRFGWLGANLRNRAAKAVAPGLGDSPPCYPRRSEPFLLSIPREPALRKFRPTRLRLPTRVSVIESMDVRNPRRVVSAHPTRPTLRGKRLWHCACRANMKANRIVMRDRRTFSNSLHNPVGYSSLSSVSGTPARTFRNEAIGNPGKMPGLSFFASFFGIC